jgi:hypothetical protein
MSEAEGGGGAEEPAFRLRRQDSCGGSRLASLP